LFSAPRGIALRGELLAVPEFSWAWRREVLRVGKRLHFQAGDVIYREHSPENSLLLIRRGRVRVFKSFFGKSRTLAMLGKGETVGEVSFFEGTERSSSVQASTDVVLLEFSRQQLLPLLMGNPRLALYFLERMATRVRTVQQDLVEGLVHRNLELEMANARLEARIRERTELELSNERLSHQAQRDHLTGALNRLGLQETLSQWTANHERPFTLLLFDIDHFKQYNDRNGHLMGDKLLRDLCSVVNNHLRSDDLLARFGGEEFAVLLSGLQPERAPEVAQRLADAITHHPFPEGEHQPLGVVSISAVLAFFPPEGTQPEQLLQLADERLYQAKAAGRKRIVTGSLPMEQQIGLGR